MLKVIFILSLLIQLAAFFLPLPGGWRMFYEVEPIQFELANSDGEHIDINDYLRPGILILSRSQLVNTVQFICNKEQLSGNITLRINEQLVGESDCNFK